MSTAAANIGATIRDLRLAQGLSQGDVEERTGLLRCYLSRVEMGHTIPSLGTLEKIAKGLEVPMTRFFSPDQAEDALRAEEKALSEEEIQFLTQVQRYTAELGDRDRRLLLAIVRKFAGIACSGTHSAP